MGCSGDARWGLSEEDTPVKPTTELPFYAANGDFAKLYTFMGIASRDDSNGR